MRLVRVLMVLFFTALLSFNAKSQRQLCSKETSHTIKKINKLLTRHYVYEDVAGRMASKLEKHHQRGVFDTISTHLTFAKILTQELKSVYNDKHMAVIYDDGHLKESVPTFPNFGVGTVRSYEGFGYLKISTFRYHHRKAKKLISEAIEELAKHDTMVLDLRGNAGGATRMEKHMISYFLPADTYYGQFESSHHKHPRKFHTYKSKRRFRSLDKPLFILVDHETFSAAESVAYHLQAFDRATIVGEITGGAAHAGRRRRINRHFLLALPKVAPIDVKTGTNWEGKGIIPDIKIGTVQEVENILHRIGDHSAHSEHRH